MANATMAIPLSSALGTVLFTLAHVFVQQPNAVVVGYTAFTLAQVVPHAFWDYNTAAAKAQNFTANACSSTPSPSLVDMSVTEMVKKTAIDNEQYDNQNMSSHEDIVEESGILRSNFTAIINPLRDASATKYWTTSKVSGEPSAATGGPLQSPIHTIMIFCQTPFPLYIGVISGFIIRIVWSHCYKKWHVAHLVILFVMSITYMNHTTTFVRTLFGYLSGEALWVWPRFEALVQPFSAINAFLINRLTQLYGALSCLLDWCTYKGSNVEDVLSWQTSRCVYVGGCVARAIRYFKADHGIFRTIANPWESTKFITVKCFLAVLVPLQKLAAILTGFPVNRCSMTWRSPLVVSITTFYIDTCHTALCRWRNPLLRCIIVIAYALASLTYLTRTKCIQDIIVTIVTSIFLYRHCSARLSHARVLLAISDAWESIGRMVTRGKATVLGLYNHNANHIPHAKVALYEGFLNAYSNDGRYHQDHGEKATEPPAADADDLRSSMEKDPAPSDSMPPSDVADENLQRSTSPVPITPITVDEGNQSKAALGKHMHCQMPKNEHKTELVAKKIEVETNRQQNFDIPKKVEGQRNAGVSQILFQDRIVRDQGLSSAIYDASCEAKQAEFDENEKKGRNDNALQIIRGVNKSDQIRRGAELEQQIGELNGLSRESNVEPLIEPPTPIRVEVEATETATISNSGLRNLVDLLDNRQNEADRKCDVPEVFAQKKPEEPESRGSKPNLEQAAIHSTFVPKSSSSDPSDREAALDGSDSKTDNANVDDSEPSGAVALNPVSSTIVSAASLPARTGTEINEEEDIEMSDAKEQGNTQGVTGIHDMEIDFDNNETQRSAQALHTLPGPAKSAIHSNGDVDMDGDSTLSVMNLDVSQNQQALIVHYPAATTKSKDSYSAPLINNNPTPSQGFTALQPLVSQPQQHIQELLITPEMQKPLPKFAPSTFNWPEPVALSATQDFSSISSQPDILPTIPAQPVALAQPAAPPASQTPVMPPAQQQLQNDAPPAVHNDVPAINEFGKGSIHASFDISSPNAIKKRFPTPVAQVTGVIPNNNNTLNDENASEVQSNVLVPAADFSDCLLQAFSAEEQISDPSTTVESQPMVTAQPLRDLVNSTNVDSTAAEDAFPERPGSPSDSEQQFDNVPIAGGVNADDTKFEDTFINDTDSELSEMSEDMLERLASEVENMKENAEIQNRERSALGDMVEEAENLDLVANPQHKYPSQMVVRKDDQSGEEQTTIKDNGRDEEESLQKKADSEFESVETTYGAAESDISRNLTEAEKELRKRKILEPKSRIHTPTTSTFPVGTSEPSSRPGTGPLSSVQTRPIPQEGEIWMNSHDCTRSSVQCDDDGTLFVQCGAGRKFTWDREEHEWIFDEGGIMLPGAFTRVS
jgi:hypothetical protein